MLIFLYGPDDYRREIKKRELIDEFQKKHSSLGLGKFDASEESGRAAFLDFIQNQSIFEPVKLAVLERVYETDNKEFVNALSALGSNSGITALISETDIPPKPFAFLRPTTKTKKAATGLVQKFDYLDGDEWRTFVKVAAKKSGAVLTPSALEFITQAYLKDTWRLVTELEKLSFLKKSPVEQEDLENLAIELAPNFWATMNSLRSERLSERLGMLERLLAKNEPAAKLFNILSAQWPERLAAFAQYDANVKSGKCEYEEVLVDLLVGTGS